MKQPFDISECEPIDIVELTIKHPATGEPTDWKVSIAGPSHHKTIEANKKASREEFRRAKQRELVRLTGKIKNLEDESFDENQQRIYGTISERIIGWTPVQLDGQAFEYSADNALKLLTDPRFVNVAQQIVDCVTEEKTFIKRSALG